MSASEAPLPTDRRFRVIWIRDDKQTRGVICPGPFTHHEACTVLRKLVPYSWRRDMVELIQEEEDAC